MGELTGKAVVVTGAGRGIGRAHCLQLAGAGAALVVNDVDRAAAEGAAGEIRSRGGRAIADGSDIAAAAGAAQLVAGTYSRWRDERGVTHVAETPPPEGTVYATVRALD